MDELFRHRAALVCYARPIVRDRAEAEDVVQEAFLRLAGSSDRSRDGAARAEVRNPLSYLYRIVRNIALDKVRRDRIERREEEAPQWWMLPPQAPSPEDEAARAQMIERIEHVLGEMEPRMRLALEMNRFEGFTLQEIAQRLGVSVATVHRLVRDALTRVALMLGEDEE
ncbi:RNA polymerase sigma factor [Novosphingobium resinovorum]|uniref:RNA polymerase sigma factor n=1 Tax=Novosphingobium resinovorum TaxID=158500 RepID=UPI002ED62EFC|nr:sigma-70 family RNA polymerase sigma factor [Novosphingobium resinovorum]